MLENVSTKDFYTEFNDCLTNGVVANTRSQTDAMIDVVCTEGIFFYFVENAHGVLTHILEV